MASPESKTASTAGMPTSIHHVKCSNRATALKDLQRRQMVHLIKLENMKPTIDMKPPQSYPHVQARLEVLCTNRHERTVSAHFISRLVPCVAQFNAKRMQMEAERNSAIERENKILVRAPRP